MGRILIGFVILIGIIAGIVYYPEIKSQLENMNPKGKKIEVKEGDLVKYDFDSLRKRGGIVSKIEFGGIPEGVKTRRENEGYKVRGFETRIFSFRSNGKKITGMMNLPMTPMSSKIPAIIMIRGFADWEGYYTGFGTWKAADKLAEQGFLTASIDFLGFGGSDGESTDILEARFEKVMSVLDLLESVRRMGLVDPNKVGIWAHSNGGQIALSVLEITSGNYPTTLWAPMTNPFPQSVLETAGDDANGRMVKDKIENFSRNYDVRRYAFENYYKWLKAPIIVHQGMADEWCKVEWQRDLQSRLKQLGRDVNLYIYRGDDHNLKKNWDEVIQRDIEFFRKNFLF